MAARRRRKDWQQPDLSREWRTFLRERRPPSNRWPLLPIFGQIHGNTMCAVRQPPRQDDKTRSQPQRAKPRQQSVRGPRESWGSQRSVSLEAVQTNELQRRTSDPSSSCGFVGQAQSRCGHFEDHAFQGQSPGLGRRSRRTFGCLIEVHRATEKPIPKWRSRRAEGSGSHSSPLLLHLCLTLSFPSGPIVPLCDPVPSLGNHRHFFGPSPSPFV